MYKPIEPIRCPKCGAIVKVDLSKFLTSNPPCYEWTCPNCGEKGYTKQGDTMPFENQIGPATSGYIQKIDAADPGVGRVTTTNADGITIINATPAIYSTSTKCIICGEEFKFDGEHRICPKCRDAIVKFREAVAGTANAMPADKSTANTKPENKSTVTDPKTTACNIPAPQFIQQGWQCPKCGAVLAPNQNYCPFCSPSEYGRINWIGTGYGEWTNRDNLTPPSGQYTNPYPITTVSLGDNLKVTDSCTHTFATPCNNLKAKL